MDERRIQSTTRSASAEVANANFQVIRKGFDPEEVRRYLEGVAREIGLLERRVQDLQGQVNDANQRAATPPPIDETRLSELLTDQGRSILRKAHDEANRIVAEAQERATHVFTQAQERASTYILDAQTRASEIITEAETVSLQLEYNAREASVRVDEAARQNADAVLEQARDEGRALLEQAHEARRQVLNELAIRRKALNVQIEQLRAARDVLTESVSSVRESVEKVLGGLLSSDEGARAAAIEALRTRRSSPEPTDEEVLRDVPLRVVPPAQTVTPDDVDVPRVARPTVSDANPVVTAPTATLGSVRLPDVDHEAVTPRTTAGDITDENVGDVIGEIFARLREATKEEKASDAPTQRRVVRERNADATPESALFDRREQALEATLADLTRQVKRALQDDQNVMIERLRDVTGMVTTEMEDELAQRGRYANAALEAVRSAAQAGVQFANAEGQVSGHLASLTVVDECATDLAATIAIALRRRIMSETTGDGAERASAAYREWRGARVERLCGDIARRAFNVGVLAAVGTGSVRFVLAPHDTPCDACAQDAASPARAAGTNFPSGQPFPPLHAGCGCLVTPA